MSGYLQKVVALAGGVGGAKFAHGLMRAMNPENLTVIVNVGDDFEHLGMRICPDVDTVCYTLAGMANASTGWGLAGETWHVFDDLIRLGGPDWFHLGDHDLATHLERTRRLRAGESLSQVMRHFCKIWDVPVSVIPVTDDPVPTIVLTNVGELSFQDYFVRLQCQPIVKGFRFEGVGEARPAPGVLEALQDADLIVLCPSNPWVSIDPILEVPGVRSTIMNRRTRDLIPVLAISPIVGGKTVKGPAAKMFTELGIIPSAQAVAEHYGRLCSGFVMDWQDANNALAVQGLGLSILVTDTIMKSIDDRQCLADEVIAFFCGNQA
jgi:LPPG:FO 2-phospho-L-lactate transferase